MLMLTESPYSMWAKFAGCFYVTEIMFPMLSEPRCYSLSSAAKAPSGPGPGHD
jgi:hypothetical protein